MTVQLLSPRGIRLLTIPAPIPVLYVPEPPRDLAARWFEAPERCTTLTLTRRRFRLVSETTYIEE
jgi:hypothetical protein